MKTSITITGQVSSNFKLVAACTSVNVIEEKKLMYGGRQLVYATKKDAVKALSEAYRYLLSDKEDYENASASYSYGSQLYYDSSTAKIETIW